MLNVVFMLICLDLSVSGFLLNVPPIKVSKGKVKCIYFPIRIQNRLQGGIYFSAAKHVYIYRRTYVHI